MHPQPPTDNHTQREARKQAATVILLFASGGLVLFSIDALKYYPPHYQLGWCIAGIFTSICAFCCALLLGMGLDKDRDWYILWYCWFVCIIMIVNVILLVLLFCFHELK